MTTLRRDTGSAFLLCLVITLVIVGVSGAYLSISHVSGRKTASDVNALQALYIAEGSAAAWIRQMPADPSAAAAATGPMAGGSFTLTPYNYGSDGIDNNQDNQIDDETERAFLRLDATGVFASTTRKLEIILSRSEGGVFWNAVFAGNSSKDPDYTLQFGGTGRQKDVVKGNVYSGGDISTSGDAALLNESGAGPSEQVMANGKVANGSSAGKPAVVEGQTQSPLDIAAMDYSNRADPDHPDYDPDLFVNVGQELEKKGKVGVVKSTSDGLGNALQIDDANNPAHLFRKDPTDGAKQRVETYGGTNTAKADYFMEDPTQDVYNGMGQDFSGGKDAQMLGVSPTGNNKVYYVDGNLWFSNAPTYTFKFKHNFPEGMKITLVVKGNIYLTDNLLYQNLAQDGIALIAVKDDQFANKTADDFGGSPAAREDAARNFNRSNGSGNIFFGDPGGGTTERFEGFLYAENNFYDNNLGTSGSMKTDIFGNMTAGNQVKIKRDPSKYSKLQVQFDDKIKTGKTKLPGLPPTPGFGGTGWKIASWKQVP